MNWDRLFVTLLYALTSCEDLDDSEELIRFAQRCESACLASAAGQGCDTEAVRANCPDFCESVISSFERDCLAEYEALLSCGDDQQYVCDEAVTVSGIQWPYIMSGVSCGDSDLLYRECLAGQTVF